MANSETKHIIIQGFKEKVVTFSFWSRRPKSFP